MRKNILSVLLCILLLMTGCTSSKSISFNEYAKKTNFKLNEETIYKGDRYEHSNCRIGEYDGKKTFFDSSTQTSIFLSEDAETGELIYVTLKSSSNEYEVFKKELKLVIDYIKSISNKDVANSVLDIVNKYDETIELYEKDTDNMSDKEIEELEYWADKFIHNGSNEKMFEYLDEDGNVSVSVIAGYGDLAIHATNRYN